MHPLPVYTETRLRSWIRPQPTSETQYAQNDPASLPGIVRSVGLRDRNHGARTAWLKEWLGTETTLEYDSQNTRILSQVHAPFDALLLHGEDQRRMSKIVREWSEVLTSKAILVAMPTPTAEDRTELLKAGADAVLDTHSAPALARAETRAVLARIQQSLEADMSYAIAADDLKTSTKLSQSERIILETVIAGRGQGVSQAAVLAKLGKRKEQAAIRTLRVQIHRLNSRLVNASVKSVKNVGLFIQPITTASPIDQTAATVR